MIQRKQTIFLLLAVILAFACLCLPIAEFEAKGMIGNATLYNLWIKGDNGEVYFGVCLLFALLLITCPLGLFTIFKYKNRKLQARLCTTNIIFIIAWYVFLAISYFYGTISTILANTIFHINWPIVLPLISAILYFMANRAIHADENLVKAADRIR